MLADALLNHGEHLSIGDCAHDEVDILADGEQAGIAAQSPDLRVLRVDGINASTIAVVLQEPHGFTAELIVIRRSADDCHTARVQQNRGPHVRRMQCVVFAIRDSARHALRLFIV